MSNIVLSEEQEVAVDKLVRWFKSEWSTQVFRVAGYAGVGKSTVVKYAIRALGLKMSEVAFVAFTGKASLVLTRKGTPAQTIHRFIYEPLISSKRDPVTGLVRSKVAGFRLKEAIPDVKLIIIDEVSMVSEDLLQALLSFKIKVLALGDPGQLPPVRGKDNGLLKNPDVFLEHIHRQAADSPIIWASMKARNGESIPLGQHGENLRVVSRYSVTVEDVLGADQVITCTHKNRKLYNQTVRDYLGFTGPLPELGEKLIAKSNRWDDVSSQTLTPIVNGLQMRLVKPVHRISKNLRSFYASYEADGVPGDFYYEMQTDMDWFDPSPGFEEGDTGSDMLHLDYGYAITCHSSQGSEWNRVLFIEDLFGDPMNRRRLSYTGRTRAAEYLTIAV